MKLKFSLLFSGLLGVMLLFSTAVEARSRGSSSPRYSGTSSYSSPVITQNQNYVATGGATTGGFSNPLGGADCDNEGICTKCRRLVGEALKSYCRENECSKGSNAFIIAKALALSSTFVNIDANIYDSPSTAIQSSVITQGQAYNQTLAQTCEPYLVKNVEELLPSFYDIVTDQCHEQYKTAIDHYMSNNQGGFLMGGNVDNTGQKRTIRNFELLEYFKAHVVNDYQSSLYQDTRSENYYFSHYCMQQMADEVKLSLIDLYIPDMYTYQRNMCRRSYEHAMQKYCVEYQANICHGEIDYMQVIMDQGFLSEVDSFNTQINCGTELAQDIREALTEEVVRKQNLCAREMGHYNAERDMCQFTVTLIDAKNKEIERKRYFEGESVQCNEKDFIDPYSKEGRLRVGKNWLMSETGAKIMYGAGGALLGGIVGNKVGGDVARNQQIKKALRNAGVEDKFQQLKGQIRCTNGDLLATAGQNLAAAGGITQGQAETILREFCMIGSDETITPVTPTTAPCASFSSGNITLTGGTISNVIPAGIGSLSVNIASGSVSGLTFKVISQSVPVGGASLALTGTGLVSSLSGSIANLNINGNTFEKVNLTNGIATGTFSTGESYSIELSGATSIIGGQFSSSNLTGAPTLAGLSYASCNITSTPTPTSNEIITGSIQTSRAGKLVGTGAGGVAGGALGAGATGFVYKKLYKETKCYTTWRDANDENMSVLSATDRPIAEWGGSKSFPTIVKGKNIQLDSLPVYDREYPGDPKWENK
ncbi:MAG: hypothetical protein ACTSXV_00660 [Alphaproteobacteria bacterium]